MVDWRMSRTYSELRESLRDSGKLKQIEDDVLQRSGFELKSVERLPGYDGMTCVSVLAVLLEYACYSQNELGIELGRKCVSLIPSEVLQKHFFETVISSFDFTDDWNYRRLLELTAKVLPQAMNDVLDLNRSSDDPDILECIGDFDKQY